MTTKHTFTLLSLCHAYGKIEIPIIQRDFAQGRNEQKNVRNKFVDYLVNALSKDESIELDFIYGTVRIDVDEHDKTKEIHTFIPIDGQQRLTTLWLLHWFLAIRENDFREDNKASIKAEMAKFVYETRPSAHAFCSRLISESFPKERITDIADFIESRNWFDCDWKSDGTIHGMLQMLRTFSKKQELIDGTIELAQLRDKKRISFYFVPLESFGLSEDIYIRMNARGKILTDFENFKSEFYKIIKKYPDIELVKDKMEYSWVNNLWPFRKQDKKNPVYVTDDCFMNYLKFISEMLYFNQAKPRDEAGYADDFSDLKTLSDIYSKQENVDFLVFALDVIPQLSHLDLGDYHFWERENRSVYFGDLLTRVIKGENLLFDNELVLYAAIAFLKFHPKNFIFVKDFLRIVRNLIVNTNDKSERDRPRIITSVIKLAENENPYDALKTNGFKLEGLRESQCSEERFKALIGENDIFASIEDTTWFKGNIKSLLAASYSVEEKYIQDFSFNDSLVSSFNVAALKSVFEGYKVIAKNNFTEVWGDLIDSSLYQRYQSAGRLVVVDDFTKTPGVVSLAAKYSSTGTGSLNDYLIRAEKEYVRNIITKYDDLSTIRDVKEQLQILYIITRRIQNKDISSFFHDWYNFGWLSKGKGFSSIFNSGIDGDPWFSEENPIFQTYNSQFRYSWGLNKYHAIPLEVSESPRYDLVDELKKWAQS